MRRPSSLRFRRHVLALVYLVTIGCSDDPSMPPGQESLDLVACGGSAEAGPVLPVGPPPLSVLGLGRLEQRYTSEVWVRGTTAYTSSWGLRGAGGVGNQVMLWDVASDVPSPLGCVTLAGASTTGDVQVSDDGALLVVATERTNGSIGIYDVATDPRKPRLLSRYRTANTTNGVHTAEVARVGGTLYAFLSVDALASAPARLTIVSLANPSHPVEVFSAPMGDPFVHDVFVRDGILFTALWHGGLSIWDIGGGGTGGSVASPRLLGNVRTAGGYVHNVYWSHDPADGSKRYAFVGEERPSALFEFTAGDIHVVDVSDLTDPREVAFYSVSGAGAHNFAVDEASRVLYAAYYNGGIRALDIRGDLGACTVEQRATDGRCDLALMGREIAVGPRDVTDPVSIWGVFFDGSSVYASDMLNGLWKLTPALR
jgi:hypothetical protein